MHYLPLSLPFFAILVAAFLLLCVLLLHNAWRSAHIRIGLSNRLVVLVLLGSLVGSYFNIPLAEFPQRQIISGRLVEFYGMQYVVPVMVSWPGTIVAVNVGGAVIPVVVSAILLIRHRLWLQAPLAVRGVAMLSHMLAHPVPGLGIAVPIFVPALVTAVTALVLSRQYAAPLAYIGGSVGTLVGADLLNLGTLPRLGAPIASIGGAGTFDGISLTGILAMLIAGLSSPPVGPPSGQALAR